MADLSSVTDGEMTEFKGRLVNGKLTAELLREVNGDEENGAAKAMVRALIEYLRAKAEAAIKNPFELTLDEQIAAIRAAFTETFVPKFGVPMIIEEEIANLIATAPEWPKGRDCYRVPDICWGEGREGMILTFEAHAAEFKRVHKKNWRWDQLLSGNHKYGKEDVDRLRLRFHA